MGVAEFRDCLDFLLTSNSRKLHIGGGEPTLNPNFIEMSEMAIRAGFSIFVFSNGLIHRHILDSIASRGQSFSFLMNMNTRGTYSITQWNRFLRSVGVLSEKCDVYLGINLWHPSLDLSDHVWVAENHRLRGIRVGLSNPSLVGPNAAARDFGCQNSAQYDRMLVMLEDIACRQSIPLLMDCGLTPCFLGAGEAGSSSYLRTKGRETNWGCPTSAPVIGTDLLVRHCFMTEGRWSHLRSYANHDDMLGSVTEEVQRLKALYPTRDDCSVCSFVRQCGGDCLMGRIQECRSGSSMSGSGPDEMRQFVGREPATDDY